MTHSMSTLRFVHRSRADHRVTDGPVWVPCEFDVDADGHAEIVGGSRCHKYPALAKQASFSEWGPWMGSGFEWFRFKQKFLEIPASNLCLFGN